ncbi:WecB/TagA/CpsF family glycosyltransferase [Nocardioides sp. zg-536]|uniref:WecB/TagA/CpsF family glycosyltransferase n=1 Tax=Nocardioides faecalis TaxID=2803858 RepID=A0A938Y3C0_9ACTN|nr:WecB/TagA/CpsF family glycosyltransferase [Nocardioides faecalis]MBM9461447.1 WecB/TagA/CpsF family glycosyltransferase [Nocardioides faecalis]QVI59364.1 WecB/TagA/CpsF family glycosyltransferase [Nocardioides faecalis]
MGPDISPSTGPVAPDAVPWRSRYRRKVAVVDLVALLAAATGAWLLRFESGLGGEVDALRGAAGVSHLVLSVVIALLWWLVLAWIQSRDLIVVGRSLDELRAIARATAVMVGLLGSAALLFAVTPSRGYLAGVFGLGVPLLLLGRGLLRRGLQRQRQRGRSQARVLVIGTLRSARRVARTFRTDPVQGYQVTGVWTPDSAADEESLLTLPTDEPRPWIPVLGSTHEVLEAVAVAAADTVIVTDSEQLGPDGLSSLAWSLESLGVDLLVSPNVVGVAPPRISIRDISNVPYVHIESPRSKAAAGLRKLSLGRVLSAVALVGLSPLLAGIALGVRLSGPGPVLERHRRVGAGGTPYSLHQFRITRPGASSTGRPEALDVTDDPRLTRFGAFLRRYGLDELPQLFNVLRGEMSLIGPRPLSPEQYASIPEAHAQRRLLVRPGVMGVWRTTGETVPTVEEMTRLDLEYVDNWSLTSDLGIGLLLARRLVSRFFLLRVVRRWQARLLAGSPDSAVRLRLDARGEVRLNDYPLFTGSLVALLEKVEDLLALRRPTLMVTTNVDQILDLERQAKTVDVYDAADVIVLDGMPVVQLARMLGADDVHRHTGADLLPLLAAESVARRWRIAVMGGADDVAQRAVAALRTAHPGTTIDAVDFPLLDGLEDPASLKVIEDLRVLDPDIVFVCLGAPKQELWYLQWRELLPPALYIGAGAAVDFAAQQVTRAPVVLQRLGLEWTWRLAQEPRRLAGRYLAKGPRFLWVIGRSLLRRDGAQQDYRG